MDAKELPRKIACHCLSPRVSSWTLGVLVYIWIISNSHYVIRESISTTINSIKDANSIHKVLAVHLNFPPWIDFKISMG